MFYRASLRRPDFYVPVPTLPDDRTIEVPGPALDVIGECLRSLDRGGTPCLALPDEAWREPRLAIGCPRCAGPLRLNPFVVDGRGD